MTGIPQQDGPALVADVGGTHIRMALARSGHLEQPVSRLCSEYDSLGAALGQFVESIDPTERPRRAAVAVASPVTADWIQLTNQPWSFSIQELRRALELERLEIVNDFTALALGVPDLGEGDTRMVKPGTAKPGAARAVLGPGTGLGVSGLIPTRGGWIPLSTEGGHRDLAAGSPREWEVVNALRRRIGHVSAERVLSGPGLVRLYGALCEIEGEPATLNVPGEVVERATVESGGCASEATRMFSSWLGSTAGDLVLTLGARGGLYLGGGVIPKMGRAFETDLFCDRFLDKGRLRGYLEPVPVHLVLHPQVALLGAARLLGAPADDLGR